MLCMDGILNRATKMFHQKKKKGNAVERLEELSPPFLTFCRLRGDLIETYKIQNTKYDNDTERILELDENWLTRAHSLKLRKDKFKKDIGKFTNITGIIRHTKM